MAVPEPVSKRPPASAKQRAQAIQPYALALARIQDYQRLAQLRGHPLLTDYRHRMLFCYAVSAVWYRTDVAGLAEELDGFAAEHFADATRYTTQRVRSVLKRLSETQAGIVGIWRGARVPRRYQLTNRTIITMLDITPGEQRQLKTLISPAERNRRREERRRAQGQQTRVAYLATVAQRRDAVLNLKKEGRPASLIADSLGLSKRHVNRIIAAEHPDLFVT